MNEVRYQGVLLNDEGVSEHDRGRRMVFVPRGEIQEIRHEVGWRAERPVVQAVIGGTLLAGGLYLLRVFVRAILREGMAAVFPTIEVTFGVILPMLGGWALLAAFSRGEFLRIVLLNGDSRKILLRRAAPEELAKFVRQAREIGYSVVER